MRKEGKESNVQDIYTLTPMQEGMLYHAMLEETSAAYFEQRSHRLCGELNPDIVKRSLNELCKRYDILRTAFINQEASRPVQVVLKQREVDFLYEDIRPMVGEGRDKEKLIRELKEKDRQRLFDLAKDPLMRVTVIQTDDHEYELLWSHHHILMDGWCTDIIVTEFWEIYNSVLENRSHRLPPVKQFRTYINWLGKQDKEKLKEYWGKYLDAYEEAVRVPKINNYTFSGEDSYKNEFVYLNQDREKTAALSQMAGRNQVTLNIIAQTLWGILLGKYSSKEDVVFGAVVSGRPSDIPDVELMVGLFINTIPVRIRFDGKRPFNELVKQIQEEAVQSEPYHHYPLADVQSLTPLKQDLIDHIFVFENYPVMTRIDPGTGSGTIESEKIKTEKNEKGETSGHGVNLKLSAMDVYEHTHYDFNILLVPGETLLVKFQYNGNAYERKGVERIARHFNFLLNQVLTNETVAIETLTLLAPEDKEEILYQFNNTRKKYNGKNTIHQLFEEQVERTPHDTALIFEGREMTYSDLNQKANQLAGMLREKGLKPNDVVGLMVERSFELIIGILAILKAGGAYLPIDPQYPEKRVSTMLKDSQAKILLSQQRLLEQFPIDILRKIKTEPGSIEPLITPGREPIKMFDNLPKPNRTLIDYGKYHQHIGLAMARRTVSLQATRGCPYNCAYCHKIWPKTHVVRSAENIFEEVSQCCNAGVKKFVFVDDIFNLDKKNSIRFFEKLIKEKMDVQLFFPNGVRTDILTREFIDLMMEAGTVNMAMALESASPRIQKMIRKNLNLEKFQENVRYIIDNYPQMISEIFMMIGFPTETEEEAQMTLDMLESFKWIHFPDLFLLKIFPNSDMYRLAVEKGVPRELIERSHALAYHEIPDTIPFSKSFARQYQSRFLNNYFLDKERLLHVLPLQMKILTEDELVLKYDSYLPADINRFSDILELAGITMEELGSVELLKSDPASEPDFNKEVKKYFPTRAKGDNALRVLLMDTSLLFTVDAEKEDILYDMVEEPLGLMYLLSYLDDKFDDQVKGKVIKSRIDFDSYKELKAIIDAFNPDLIGIRTLSVYKEFFHAVVFQIREWGIQVPIIAGGPYATSDFKQMMLDPNVDLAVLGEGELTVAQLIEAMISAGKQLPDEGVLRTIKGIAFIEKEDKFRLKQLYREIIPIDGVSQQLSQYPSEDLTPINSDTDLLYVIYTSGSTGIPKGVMLEHRNLTNLIHYQHCETNIDFSSVLQFTTASFDVSFQEIFSTLIAGGTLSLVSTDTRQNIRELFRVVEENGVKTMFLPPSFLKFIFNEEEYVSMFPRCVNHIVTAGEQLVVTERLKHYLSANNVVLHNHYGPTESHVVTALTMEPGTPIPTLPPIGTPIANTGIYIVDENRRLQPVGAAGELYIGGIQVGRGYFHQEQMTNERFVSNHLKEGDRLYKTGDMARWLMDGNIDFLGRKDHQVKIRGFRIELEEIENQLMDIPIIKKALVIHKADGTGQKFLCAYVVSNEEVDMVELKDTLAENLPDYMVPAYFTQLKEIPLTPNGKVDYKALPDPKGMVGKGKNYEAPANETEEKIVEIWAEVLELDPQKIGVNDNFFDLGGNSLTILKVISRINKIFKNNISIGSLFLNATVRNLATAVYEENILNQLECIVKLNNGKNERNLFLLHPVHGMVYQYKELARLLEKHYNVYGVQARGILRDSHLPENFDEMVVDYVHQILQIQKKGPFTIAAYCLGNLTALKLVNLLEHLNYKVDKFIMFDEELWIPLQVQWYYLWKHRFSRLFKPINTLRSKFRRKNDAHPNPYVREYEQIVKEIETREAAYEKDRGAKDRVEQPLEQKEKVKKHLRDVVMAEYYRSTPYTWMTGILSADLYNIKAEESNPEKFLLRDMKGCSFGKTAVIEMPGHHHTMFFHPYVEKLAEIIINL